MQDDRTRLLQTPRHDLDQARRDPSAWTQLAFTADHTTDGRIFDRHRAARFGVLWAAQYDRRQSDLPLLRFLLQEEITRYREALSSGLAPDLELAGLLVAEHRQVEDVWLHWQAKQISFDTALGYRTFYLLTGGVAATIDAVEAGFHPDRDRILHEITQARNADGTPHFTDASVDEWLAKQSARFPGDPNAEDTRVWANHAARLGEREASRRFIRQWAEGQDRTERTLNILQFHLAGLGYLDEAIEVQTEVVGVGGSGPAQAGRLLRLVKLHRLAGNFAEARQALCDCGEVIPTDRLWKEAGLWRYFIKEHFLLAPMAPDPDIARLLIDDGARHMRGVTGLWMDGLLDAAIAAAEHIGDDSLRDHYLDVQQTEVRARDRAGRPETG